MAFFFRVVFGSSIVVAAGCFGAVPATMLPASVGAVRNLAGVVGFAAGAGIAAWLLLSIFGRMPVLDIVRELRTGLLLAAVPVLLYWGPIVGGTSLAQGISDQGVVEVC